MSYELRRDQKLGANLRRICRKQVASALQIARGEVEPDDTPVHQTRKHLKKARAVLRMVAEEIGRGLYKQQDRSFRDIGRLISDVRDAEVRLQTVRQLQEITWRQSNQTFHKTEELLLGELEHFLAAFAGWQKQAATELEKLCREIEKWPIEELNCKCVRAAVQRGYKSGRDAFNRAQAKPTPENFHEFRSETKRLFYQLRILRPINPLVIGALLDELGSLAEVLGRSHDLHFLGERLRRDDSNPSPAEAHALVAVIEKSELELQKRSVDVAAHFFDERPKDFGNRLGGWLLEWIKGEAPTVADALICKGDVLGLKAPKRR
ncbi:MAG TPA: CHAD domain-containing protein [Chthoniobacterales bacterium]